MKEALGPLSPGRREGGLRQSLCNVHRKRGGMMANSYDLKRLLMVPVHRWRTVVAVTLIPTLIVGALVIIVAGYILIL